MMISSNSGRVQCQGCHHQDRPVYSTFAHLLCKQCQRDLLDRPNLPMGRLRDAKPGMIDKVVDAQEHV